LAVQQRETSRPLLFDEDNQLCGRRTGQNQTVEMVRPSQNPQALAFSGVHMISPRLLESLSGDGAFSIITSYLSLAGKGQKILAFRADDYYWLDVGRPENVMQATEDVGRNTYPL
jgi:NDP-sugar pyrophosphorylase family protein